MAKRNQPPSENCAVRVSCETHRLISELAGQDRVSRSALVERAIAAYTVIRDLKLSDERRPKLEVRA